jgi:hypothetical protein
VREREGEREEREREVIVLLCRVSSCGIMGERNKGKREGGREGENE